MKNKLAAKSLFPGLVLAAALFLPAQPLLAGGKLSVEKQVTVNTSPETAWKMVGHFNHLDVWHPVVAMSTVKGNADKKGAVRVLTLADGAKLIEVLLRHSDYDKSYTYKITKSPLPVMNYESTVSVKSAPGGKAVVTWSATFDAKDAPDEKAVEAISGVYEAGLGQVERHFN